MAGDNAPFTRHAPSPQSLLEVPLLGYLFAPDSTQDRIDRFKAWTGRKGRPTATIGAAVIGVILVARASSVALIVAYGPRDAPIGD